MNWSVSETAEWGGYKSGPRIITAETKAEMKKILAEIQSGQFVREWIAEYDGGLNEYKKLYDATTNHPIEQVGKKLRGLMSWVDTEA
jgi:ketol-acid reductoisomerase